MNIVRLMLLSRQMKNRRHEKNNMVTGIPPLNFIVKNTGALKNYRIYGNTENGESVGDKTKNLAPNISLENGWQPGYLTGGQLVPPTGWGEILSPFISLNNVDTFTVSASDHKAPSMSIYYFNGNNYMNSVSANNYSGSVFNNIPNNATHFRIAIRSGYLSIDAVQNANWHIMINEGSTALPYEPYGYKIPVTLTADSAETTDIYLDEPLAKSGDIADYIDYMAQKRHNSDGTESSVTLPEIAVTAGTNTFTVGTEVQPSRVELTGRIKEAQTNGSGNT